MYETNAVRVELFGDEIDALSTMHPTTGELLSTDDEMYVFPASHYVAGPERMERAIASIEAELEVRLKELESQNKLLEAQRLQMRTGPLARCQGASAVLQFLQLGGVAGVDGFASLLQP